MAAVTPAKRKWSGVATVTLLVGEAQTVFHIHEAVLFKASSFFKAAFTSEFRESSERTMTLPEDDESIFELFVDWLYHQRYDMGVLPSRNQSNEIANLFMQRIQLYVLADKYDVPKLKRLALSQVFFLIKHGLGPTMHIITYAYQHTSQNAGIRRMFADHLASILHPVMIPNVDLRQWLRKEPEVASDVVCSVAKHNVKIQNPFTGEMPEEYLSG